MKTPVRIPRLGLACVVALAAGLASAPPCSAGTVLGGVDLGSLPDYLFGFLGNASGSGAFNLQGATDGYQGDIAVNANPTASDLRTSGAVPYQGTMITNSNTLGAWQTGIIRNNNLGGSFPLNNAVGITGQPSLISGLQSDLQNAFNQINALPATSGFSSVSATSLNGLDVTNNPNHVFVINITSGFTNITSKINITGNADDIFILRWDTTPGTPDYNGQVKFASGGGIVPQGGLTPTNFINVAGDINSSGGGTTPLPPYPQGVPIQGGAPFGGGGFFTGYWLTTGDPVTHVTANAPGDTGSLSNGIFVGGWYTNTIQFSLTSGSSGVFVPPPQITAPGPGVPEPSSVILVGFGIATVGLIAWRRRRRVAA